MDRGQAGSSGGHHSQSPISPSLNATPLHQCLETFDSDTHFMPQHTFQKQTNKLALLKSVHLNIFNSTLIFFNTNCDS